MFDVTWHCSNCICKGIEYLVCLGPAQMFSSQSSRLKQTANTSKGDGDKNRDTKLWSEG